jgi:hypothetical protein
VAAVEVALHLKQASRGAQMQVVSVSGTWWMEPKHMDPLVPGRLAMQLPRGSVVTTRRAQPSLLHFSAVVHAAR